MNSDTPIPKPSPPKSVTKSRERFLINSSILYVNHRRNLINSGSCVNTQKKNDQTSQNLVVGRNRNICVFLDLLV